MNFNVKKAFTLAEVLVVLVILGIVAVMTLPAIMQSTQDQEFKTAYKKAFQAASSATNKAISDNAFLPQTTQFEGGGLNKTNFKTFESYFNVTKDCSSNNNDKCWNSTGEKLMGGYPMQNEPAFIDSSGMTWSMYFWQENIILVDTNGFKGPNHYGKDRWLYFYTDKNNNHISSGLPSKIIPGNDELTLDTNWCNYPPCYYRSWLMQ